MVLVPWVIAGVLSLAFKPFQYKLVKLRYTGQVWQATSSSRKHGLLAQRALVLPPTISDFEQFRAELHLYVCSESNVVCHSL